MAVQFARFPTHQFSTCTEFRAHEPARFAAFFPALLLLGVLLSFASSLQAAETNAQQVLFVNSYHKGYRWSDDIVSGAVDTLQAKVPIENIHVEYLDTKRLETESYLKELRNLFALKYKNMRFDVIITSDDNAYNFVREMPDFAGVPLVFCGLSRFVPEDIRSRNENLTGVIETLDPKDSIDLALKLFPHTKNIHVVAGAESTIQTWMPILEDATEGRPGVHVSFLLGKELTTEEMIRRVAEIRGDSILLAAVWNKDKDDTFISVGDVSARVAAVAQVPIMAMDRTWVQNGAFGGRIAIGYPHGQAAAEYALRVLDGEPAADIPIRTRSINPYIFNYTQLVRFGIGESRLPANSMILNRPAPTFYEQYKTLVWGVITVMTLLASLVIALTLNIISRQHAESALHESRALYQDIVETAQDLIWQCDAEGRYIYLNPAWESVFGYRLEEMLNHPFTDFQDSENAARDRAEFARLLEGGAATGYKTVHRAKDGREIHLVFNSKFVRNEDDAVVGTRGTAYDVTAQTLLEERLRQREKMEAIGQLAGGVAHDFNNQLAGILGYAELLECKLTDPSLKHYAETIRTAARRSADLTRQMLAFARHGKYISVPVDMNAIIREVVEILKHSIDKRISIRLNLEPEPAVVIGDASQFQNSLLNLALNSRDAMPNGGELIFTTAIETLDTPSPAEELEAGRYLVVSVTDSGVGMDAQTQKRIFEPFFTTKPPGQGTGLGLAAVYGTVRNHGGTVHVYSKPGRGSTFRVRLPMPVASKAVLPTPTRPAPPEKCHGRILLVDDEVLILDVARALLTDLGYEVKGCSDPVEAIEIYRSGWRDIDLVILDMVMPKLAGKDLFLAMRRVNPKIRAILSSGYSLNGEAQAILAAGVLAFIQKPFLREVLAQEVANALKEGA